MELHAGHHLVAQFGGLTFNMDTIYMTWLTMAIVIILAIAATRKRALVPSGVQNAVEMILESLMNQIQPTLGSKWKQAASLIFTYFLFILVANQIGLLPPPGIELTSPTNDLNTTLTLAVISSLVVWALGIYNKGFHYFAHYFKPFKVFIIMNLLEEVFKPLTLAFRLFGNILAGEILLELLNYFTPPFLPIVWILFSMMIGIIQAFIFAILVTSYLRESVGDEETE